MPRSATLGATLLALARPPPLPLLTLRALLRPGRGGAGAMLLGSGVGAAPRGAAIAPPRPAPPSPRGNLWPRPRRRVCLPARWHEEWCMTLDKCTLRCHLAPPT